jgi:hypothetical protein
MSKLEMLCGLPTINHANQFCDTCVLAKHRRGAFPKQSKYHADKALELVHGDLYGPVKLATLGGWRYFLLLVDDATLYMWVALLAAKSEAAGAIRRIQAAAEKECGHKLKVLRTDNGGEFTAVEFATYYADEGVTRHFSVPYTPQQNGVVEWRNQTVVAMARALLKQRGMLAEFWREAVVTAVYLQNRLTTKSLVGRMPYEAWHSRKLADRSYAGIFIGYIEGAKAYRILDPVARQVCSARDVALDDAHGWDWAATTGMPSTAEFTVDYIYTENSGAAVVARPHHRALQARRPRHP